MRLLKKIGLSLKLINKKSDTGGLPDYNIYTPTIKEKVKWLITAAMFIFAVAFIFYRNWIISLVICPIAVLYPRMKIKSLILKRKDKLLLQFRDLLFSLSSSLSAGKSVEMSFREVLKDLEIIYNDRSADILTETRIILKRIEMNQTVEYALNDFAMRSGLEDVLSFAEVFAICKRSGGNIIETVKNTSNIIGDKVEIKQDIKTLLAQRSFEQKILSIMPVGLILMLSTTASDYMEPVFNTLAGRIAVSVSVMLLVCAYFISKKIMDIEV